MNGDKQTNDLIEKAVMQLRGITRTTKCYIEKYHARSQRRFASATMDGGARRKRIVQMSETDEHHLNDCMVIGHIKNFNPGTNAAECVVGSLEGVFRVVKSDDWSSRTTGTQQN